MARPLRIEFPGGVYHVTSRGDRRESIYAGDADRLAWLELFAGVCKRFNWVCHAWCQMTNHYHIVVETADGNLANGMRQLNGVYTQYVNRTHQRVGHVFQGRYKAIHVDAESHLLELARYVVLNPVRASMVKSVQDWPWCSYPAMVGDMPRPLWLQTDSILGKFGTQRIRAVAGYMDFVQAGIGLSNIWDGLRGQIYLGSESFAARVQKKIDAAEVLSEVPRAQRRPPARPIPDFAARYSDRQRAMAMAYLSGDHTMKAIAEHFGVHYATVSRAVRKTPCPPKTPGMQ
jgi:putative transposase